MYGVFIYPPIDFIDIHRKPKNKKEDYNLPFEKYKWSKDFIYITYNGFVGCSNSDKIKCVRKINSILFSITLLNSPRISISESDLNTFRIDNTNNLLSHGSHYHITSINHIYHLDSELRSTGTPPPLINKHQLDNIIRFAKELYKSSNFIWQITFYNGWSRFDRKDYVESFINNWLVVEIYVRNKIRNYYKDKMGVINSEVLDELDRRQIRSLILICKSKNLIESGLLKRIDKMRDIRNKIIHGTSQITQKRAEKCNKLANDIFWENLQDAGIPYKKYYNNRI